jgi:hypothetical protein
MIQLPGKLVNEVLVILSKSQDFRLEVTCITATTYALTINTQTENVNKILEIARCVMASHRVNSDYLDAPLDLSKMMFGMTAWPSYQSHFGPG